MKGLTEVREIKEEKKQNFGRNNSTLMLMERCAFLRQSLI